MNRVLQENLETIRKYKDYVYFSEDIVESYNRENVNKLAKYNDYQIRSMVDQDKAINVWCDQFENITEKNIVVVYGLNDCKYFVEFKRRYPKIWILVYSPSDELLLKDLSMNNYSELLSCDTFVLCAGTEKYNIFNMLLRKVLGADNTYDVYYAAIPNFSKIFEMDYSRFRALANEIMEAKYLSRNTFIEQEEIRLDNYLNNLKWISKSSNIKNIKKSFNQIEVEKYPAIIVATGPSLNKNVEYLKKVKGKACVFCVDASVKIMNNYGIRPDVILTVDPNFKKQNFEEGIGHELPLVFHIFGNKNVAQTHAGKKIIVSDIDYYIDSILEDFNVNIDPLESGGSVANNAFSLAMQLGFKTIILIGQDLGFPDNKQHAEGAFDDEEDVKKEDGLYYVEGVYGTKVLTNIQMDHYRHWFENQIKRNEELKVIDATEGGALIDGTEIMLLKEAISKYCNREIVDFEALFCKGDNILRADEIKMFDEKINQTFADIDENIMKLEKSKRDYYKLRRLNNKGKYNTLEFKKTFKKITEINHYIETEPEFMLYRMCCNRAHYNMLDAIATEYSSAYEEINEMIKQSLNMIDEYIGAGRRLKTEWNKVKYNE